MGNKGGRWQWGMERLQTEQMGIQYTHRKKKYARPSVYNEEGRGMLYLRQTGMTTKLAEKQY